MRLTINQLRRIIKEEVSRAINESPSFSGGDIETSEGVLHWSSKKPHMTTSDGLAFYKVPFTPNSTNCPTVSYQFGHEIETMDPTARMLSSEISDALGQTAFLKSLKKIEGLRAGAPPMCLASVAVLEDDMGKMR